MKREHLPAEMVEVAAPPLPPPPPEPANAPVTATASVSASPAPSMSSGTIQELRELLEAQGDLVREMEAEETPAPTIPATVVNVSAPNVETPAERVADVQPIDQEQETNPHPVIADAPPPEMRQEPPKLKRKGMLYGLFFGHR